MPHRLASLQHSPTHVNPMTYPRLRIVPPIAAGLPKEYKLRLLPDPELPGVELPTGKDWMIVLIPGEATIVAFSRAVLAAADHTTQAMIEACWTGYRTLLDNP